MAVSRADTLTQIKKQKEFYSDFLDSFAVSPIGGVLARVTNEKSVKQSVKNLILTNLGGMDSFTGKRIAGERLFQPLVGSDVNRSLFEHNDLLTIPLLVESIKSTVNLYEPRAQKLSVNIIPSNDEHYLIINVIFYVINNPVPIDLTLNLRRVR